MFLMVSFFFLPFHKSSNCFRCTNTNLASTNLFRRARSDHETQSGRPPALVGKMLNDRRCARRRHARPTRVPSRTRSAAHRRTHPCAACPARMLASLVSCANISKALESSQMCACSTCRCRCAARKGQDAVSVRLRSRLSHLRAISRASCPGAREPQARVRVKKKVISGSHRLP